MVSRAVVLPVPGPPVISVIPEEKGRQMAKTATCGWRRGSCMCSASIFRRATPSCRRTGSSTPPAACWNGRRAGFGPIFWRWRKRKSWCVTAARAGASSIFLPFMSRRSLRPGRWPGCKKCLCYRHPTWKRRWLCRRRRPAWPMRRSSGRPSACPFPRGSR